MCLFKVENSLVDCLGQLAQRLVEEEEGSTTLLERICRPVLETIQSRLTATSMILFSSQSALPLLYFVKSPLLARVLILHSFPKQVIQTIRQLTCN
jgi:uncharacterized protein YggT (Ycf19 family)